MDQEGKLKEGEELFKRSEKTKGCRREKWGGRSRCRSPGKG